MEFVLLYGAFIAFIAILLVVVICISIALFLLPYAVWRGIENSTGKHLELLQTSPTTDLKNAYKWYKSLITHKPAF